MLAERVPRSWTGGRRTLLASITQHSDRSTCSRRYVKNQGGVLDGSIASLDACPRPRSRGDRGPRAALRRSRRVDRARRLDPDDAEGDGDRQADADPEGGRDPQADGDGEGRAGPEGDADLPLGGALGLVWVGAGALIAGRGLARGARI